MLTEIKVLNIVVESLKIVFKLYKYRRRCDLILERASRLLNEECCLNFYEGVQKVANLLRISYVVLSQVYKPLKTIFAHYIFFCKRLAIRYRHTMLSQYVVILAEFTLKVKEVKA